MFKKQKKKTFWSFLETTSGRVTTIMGAVGFIIAAIVFLYGTFAEKAWTKETFATVGAVEKQEIQVAGALQDLRVDQQFDRLQDLQIQQRTIELQLDKDPQNKKLQNEFDWINNEIQRTKDKIDTLQLKSKK